MPNYDCRTNSSGGVITLRTDALASVLAGQQCGWHAEGPYQNSARQLAVQAREEEFLTVNMVMPAVDDTAKEAASFARLLFGLTALALERFDATQGNHVPDASRKLEASCSTDLPVDPFDGRLLRFHRAENGYELRSTGPDLSEAPGGKSDLALTVVGSPQVSPPEGAQSQAASSSWKQRCNEQTCT
jgi:hypothetical protein